jgi:serine/threonine protein kinase
MIHGDLKGVCFRSFESFCCLTSSLGKANILIDEAGRARLADFGLLTIISDPTNLLSSGSSAQGGTVRWMSPELIAPEEFGFEKSRPTKPSDCYALGMVIYETISGNIPFHEYTDLAVFVRVMGGKHPTGGARFSRNLWKMLESCWALHPKERPSVEEVLRCLGVASSSPELPALGVDEEQDDDWDPANCYSWILTGISDAAVAKRGALNRMGWRARNATSGPEPTVSSWASGDVGVMTSRIFYSPTYPFAGCS